MGKVTGFLEFARAERKYAPVEERIQHWHEFVLPMAEDETKTQAARCMDCGIPYCQTGCPVNNQIPDWNDLVYHSDWQRAAVNLHSTNNFPEVTGRVCPAPCEAACTLNIDDTPVTIKAIECAIADRGFEEGWIVPKPADKKTGKKIAVIGSGPAGLAAAQQLARAGHDVHVYEKNARPGGLLVYGIPDFKMEKSVIARRVRQMEAEGVTFHCNVNVGVDVTAKSLDSSHDAVLLAIGSERPFDFFADAPGRNLDGIHFAMDFLPQQNRRVAGETIPPTINEISAKDKHVIVIGGGDTGSDCIGTSIRQGAKSVTQLEIMPKPPVKENKAMSWPNWPMKLRISSSQAEGAETVYSVSTTGFSGEDGKVKKLNYVQVDEKLQPIPGSEASLDADLVLLAMGFSGPIEDGLVNELELSAVPRGRFKGLDADEQNYKLPGDNALFAAGDIRRGQSLVVWAIREGRQAAHAIDKFLMGSTVLPR
ncbi:Glutamate synthase [NADPH] small chain [Candidatus Filomicrobium marinum]|uniref:Glutamate synthase [NADPH] small chain n=2 Tax=Filomicrobium TaxID=119044 RepID=A0A0D6JGR0_9HYPH|nr:MULTISPECIES: glutamate synthase subunit beta [Filomicrobium]CFX29093.1 Glutamate synthase [NADPH] small chain [Candidatus Filomicrobium marinum]CPR19775.1 Glutamate synthase [NADPH] small chain [Candidatus Filomicrobium marinum]SDO01577.1 glutamate synthase (NADPH/NADH) small chain [Filomicrobium insigne]